MNYLLLAMMMCAIVAVTVRGQYVVNAPAIAMFGSSGSWVASSPASNAIDNSNTTCVMTDVNGSPGQSLIVTYEAGSFQPSTIYLVGPSVVTNDMTDAATIASVKWGDGEWNQYECYQLNLFSLTNNVASWSCDSHFGGFQMIMTMSASTPTRSVSICNVIVYSFDEEFSTTANKPNLVRAPATVTLMPASNWLSSFPATNAVDDSNTTCVYSDITAPLPPLPGVTLSVTYATTPFVPHKIYLVLSNGKTFYAYSPGSVTWGMAGSTSPPAICSLHGTSTLTSSFYYCPNATVGNQVTLTVLPDNTKYRLSVCNIIVYSKDAQFTTTTAVNPGIRDNDAQFTTMKTAAAAVNPGITQSPTSKWRLTGIIDYLLESIKLSMAEVRSLDGH